MTHALGREHRESGVESGSDMQSSVVILEELDRLVALLGRIKSPRRKFLRVNDVAWHCPINVFDGGIIHDPRFHPAIESRRNDALPIYVAWHCPINVFDGGI